MNVDTSFGVEPPEVFFGDSVVLSAVNIAGNGFVKSLDADFELQCTRRKSLNDLAERHR